MIKYKFTKDFIVWCIASIIIITTVMVAGYSIIDVLAPKIIDPFIWDWDGVLMLSVICISISWIIHGAGFVIIKG